MDSSDDVAMALLADSSSGEDEPEQPQASGPPTQASIETQGANRLPVPFYELAPGEVHPDDNVPTFVYANKVYYWTERNLTVLAALIPAVLNFVEDELDMPEEERCVEQWRNHRFEGFNGRLSPGETYQRARELQLKLDVIEMVLLGFRPDWIPPPWFPSSLPPPILPPRNDELRSISGLHPASNLRSPSPSDEYESRSTIPRNRRPGTHQASRRGRRQVSTGVRGPGRTANVEAGPSSRAAERREGEAGTQEQSDVGSIGSTARRGLRPRSSLRAPLNPDGTTRVRPSFTM